MSSENYSLVRLSLIITSYKWCRYKHALRQLFCLQHAALTNPFWCKPLGSELLHPQDAARLLRHTTTYSNTKPQPPLQALRCLFLYFVSRNFASTFYFYTPILNKHLRHFTKKCSVLFYKLQWENSPFCKRLQNFCHHQSLLFSKSYKEKKR